MLARVPPPSGPAFDDAAMAEARTRALDVWTEESARERDRLLTLPSPARLAALDDDTTRSLLRPEHRAELRASLAPAAAADAERRSRAMEWAAERRRMVALRIARPAAAVAVPVLALAPPALAAWRWRWTPGDLFAVATDGAALAGAAGIGVAAAAVAAVLAARRVSRARSLEQLGVLAVVALAAGVAGTVVAGFFPVYRAWPAVAPLADGRSLAGAVVKVAEGRTLHVLTGSAEVPAGTVVVLPGGDPVAYLRGR